MPAMSSAQTGQRWGGVRLQVCCLWRRVGSRYCSWAGAGMVSKVVARWHLGCATITVPPAGCCHAGAALHRGAGVRQRQPGAVQHHQRHTHPTAGVCRAYSTHCRCDGLHSHYCRLKQRPAEVSPGQSVATCLQCPSAHSSQSKPRCIVHKLMFLPRRATAPRRCSVSAQSHMHIG